MKEARVLVCFEGFILSNPDLHLMAVYCELLPVNVKIEKQFLYFIAHSCFKWFMQPHRPRTFYVAMESLKLF